MDFQNVNGPYENNIISNNQIVSIFFTHGGIFFYLEQW